MSGLLEIGLCSAVRTVGSRRSTTGSSRGSRASGRLNANSVRCHSRCVMQKMHDFMRLNINCSVPEKITRRTAAAALLAFGAARAMGQRPAGPVRVAAASDLKFVMDELAARYREQTGVPVQVTFGSSGQFAQQIRHGLPVDLYLSADEGYVFQLADAGLTQGRGVVYALGRVAVIVPKSSAVALEPGLASLRAALPAMRAFAIANPGHAPYGRAAQQALERLGLWPMVRGKLVLGENVAQATQYVTSGAAQAGITGSSLALAPAVAGVTRSMVLPPDLHAPMRQRMVLLRGAAPEAAGFHQFLQGDTARAALQRHGFGAA